MMLNWIISSSLLIVAVIILRFALRGRMSPVVGYLLWGLVLVRLLVPVSVMHVPYSAASLVESTQLSQDLERLEQVDGVMQEPDGEVIGYMEGYYKPDGTPMEVQTQIAEYADEATFQRWQRVSALKNFAQNILLPVWLVGIGIVAVWFIAVNAIFTRRLRRTRQRLEADCPRPVYISEAVETPCLHGLFSPAIYVTPAVAADETALRHVLSHELSHYRHRDHIWGIFRAAALALHWYNPLVWYAAALSRRDAELACDEAAIEALGEERRMDYGRTLIALSCRSARANDLILTATTMTGGKRTLKERIVLIAKKPQTKAAAVFFAAVIVIFAAVFTFAGSLPMGESYIRNSTARNRAPAWRFDLTDEITTVHLYHKFYKDEEFYTQGEERFDAALLRGLSYDIIGWEETSEGTVFRINDQYHGYPDWENFLLGGGLNLSGDGWGKVNFNVLFGEEFTARYCTWSWLQLQKPQTIQKGDTITLFNIGIYEEPHYAAGDGEYKDTAKARIIYELYFE